MNNVQQKHAMRTFQRNKDQKITDIQEAFTELINTIGYEKTTIRQIASRADISVGIIYRYFPQGKPSIAAALYEKNLRANISHFAIEPDKEILDKILRNHLKSHNENKAMYKAFDQAILSNQDVFESAKKDRKTLLKEYVRENKIPGENVDRWLTSYNVIDAIIHRHLFINNVCENDEKLIQLLFKIVESFGVAASVQCTDKT
jgi:AcrR family transcriptional regulator